MARIKQIKIVISVHNILPHERKTHTLFFEKITSKILFTLADTFIVHNKRNKETFIKKYNIDPEKVFIITHGVFHMQNVRGITQKEAKKHLSLPLGKQVILFFGYIREYKGLDVLIKAMSQLQDKQKNLLLLILAAALFFAYQKWQEGTEMETAQTPSWESERPVGGGPAREWESAPRAMIEHNRQAGQPGMSQPAMRNAVKKGLGQKRD